MDANNTSFFFLNSTLYQKISQDKAKNVLRAFDCMKERTVVLPYSEVDRRAQRAFRKTEMKDLINRGQRSLEYAVKRGDIPEPVPVISSDGTVRDVLWSEDHVWEIWEYYTENTKRRKDGSLVWELPSRQELRAQMRSGRLLYVKEGGEYIPVWKADSLFEEKRQ